VAWELLEHILDVVEISDCAVSLRLQMVCYGPMVSVAVQDAIAASLLAPACSALVLDQSAALAPTLDKLLDSQRWAMDFWPEIF